MIKKVFEKVKQMTIENYKFIFFLIVFYFIITIPLPYYIHTTGGLIDVSDKVSIQDEYTKKGSINLSYVTEMRGNVLTYLLSYVIPGWDLVSQNDYVSTNETYEDADYRNRILLDEANANATIVAYSKAGKTINIKDRHYYVVYVDILAHTDLKIGDEIISVNGNSINSMQDYMDQVFKTNLNANINISVKDKSGVIQNRKAKVFEYEDKKVTGIMVSCKYEYDAIPKISFHFKESESGPSGGLMMSLAIYNKLIKDDLTKGFTIVGTGTIDVDGNVGEISGIEYKLQGAVDAHADIFIAPLGDNYNDAIKLKKKNHYKISIVGVSTFDDALSYLRNL